MVFKKQTHQTENMKTILKILPGFLAILLIIAGCTANEPSDQEKQMNYDDQLIQAYLHEKDIDAVKTSSGVYIEPLRNNANGKAVNDGDVICMLYSMKLLTGDYVVETYADTLHPLKFSHTPDGLIPIGLNQEIDQMHEGEKYRFFIPSSLAYGNNSEDGAFSANANFIIDVDLVAVKTEDEVDQEESDSVQSFVQHNYPNATPYPDGLYIVNEVQGTGSAPDNGGGVTFHFTRKYLDGTVIETTTTGDPLQVYFFENRLVPGLEEGVKQMKAGGKALLIMPSKLGFGASIQVIPQKVRQQLVADGQLEPKVRPYTPIMYEVELISTLQ